MLIGIMIAIPFITLIFAIAYYFCLCNRLKKDKRNANKILGKECMNRLFERYKTIEEAQKGNNTDISICKVKFDETDFNLFEDLDDLSHGLEQIIKVMIER